MKEQGDAPDANKGDDSGSSVQPSGDGEEHKHATKMFQTSKASKKKKKV